MTNKNIIRQLNIIMAILVLNSVLLLWLIYVVSGLQGILEIVIYVFLIGFIAWMVRNLVAES